MEQNDSKNVFPLVSHTLKYQGSILTVYQDLVELPNGNTAKWDVIDHKGAAAVIPVMSDGRILMVRQYRHAIGRYTLEIPAGGRNSRDEKMEDAARRELEEETGYCSDDMELLISIHTVAAYSNERINIYTARNLRKGCQNLDDDEFIDVKPYSVEEISDMIFHQEIQDAKTISAVMSYRLKYGK